MYHFCDNTRYPIVYGFSFIIIKKYIINSVLLYIDKYGC